MRMFFDSSALVKRYIEEAGSDVVEELCGEASEIAVSMIAPIEVVSALNRLKTEKRISLHQYQTIKIAFFTDLSDMTVVTVDSQTVKKSIQQIESHCLKSLDAIHVANAIQWEPDIFVSSDVKQVGAAKKAGLHVKQV